jgi:hypothetical protein
LGPVKVKKSRKVLEGLEGCQNIWKEPAAFYKAKKSPKVLEGLEGCQNIWKEPAAFYKAKKSPKVLEGLEGCQNIWKEPVVRKNKGTTKCSVCGGCGHNSRKCVLKCMPCTVKMSPFGGVDEDIFGVLGKIKSTPFTGALGAGFDGRKSEMMKFSNGLELNLDLGQ